MTSCSVIIPTKQEADYLPRTLAALAFQREANALDLEIVVADGGSNDATVEIARDQADVVVQSSAARFSIAAGRNAGAEAASGELLVHTDADVVIPDLNLLIQRAERSFKNHSVVGVTAQVMPYPWDCSAADEQIHRLANAYLRWSNSVGLHFARGECQIIRRSTFELVGGYRASLVSGEDCELFRRIAKIGKLVYLSDVEVWHSVRRFRQQGYCRTLGVYAREALWTALLDRSFADEWKVVR